jgi:hypothetical protein
VDYLKLLKNSYETQRRIDECPPESPLEYLGDSFFDFTTYDGEIAALFARKAIEVCEAISARTTFEYIKDAENYRWYLLMCNMPFFVGKLDWGGSIRGAWWDHKITFRSLGLWEGDEQLSEEMTFTAEEWILFMAAVSEFSRANVSDQARRG